MLKSAEIYNQKLSELPDNQKLLISTLNAHCYNMAQKDEVYKTAILNSDVLIPDGIGIIWAVRCLTGKKLKKIAGADLFFYEMERLERIGGKCFFLGSTTDILNKIEQRAAKDYPNVKIKTYSPPFRKEFNDQENEEMIRSIKDFDPNVLMIGMTAPKQEKWAYQFYNELGNSHICCIGAVFSFYAGTIRRAPNWMIKFGLEWAYRLIKEPRRLWRRYLIGNLIFIKHLIRESFRKE